MKVLLIVISLIILNFNLGYSQGYWETISIPDTIQIKCMAANSQNNIFLGTGGNTVSGGISRSVDNCNTWGFLGFKDLGIYSIHLNENNHVFISQTGSVYKSIDNGENWILKYEGLSNVNCITSYPNGILFANSGTGSYHSIIRSLDYGTTWDEVKVFPDNVEAAYDIDLLNEDMIYVCTTDWFDGGGVYRSMDGGDNWEHIGMYDFHCMSLAINSRGDVFVGTYGGNDIYILSGVYVLYNGADNWVRHYATLVNDMILGSEDNLYVATDNGIQSGKFLKLYLCS